jgi:tetratricopeptide (TPR) repeat protein
MRRAPETLILQLQETIAGGRLAEARKAVQAALETYPEDGGLHNLAGIIDAEEQRFSQAEEHFRKAVRFSPRLVGAYLNLARLAWKQRNLEGALGYLAHARELRPDDHFVHFFFGIVCVEMDLPVEARKSLLKAVELAPDRPYYRYALGAISLQGAGAENAIPHFEAYLRAMPDDPRGRFALAVAYFQGGRIEEARREFAALAPIRETAVGANYYLGRMARSDGNLEEAARRFEAALQADPEHADSLGELGLVYLRLGREEDAKRVLDRALALDPDNRTANRSLLVYYQYRKDPRTDAQRTRVAELEAKRDEARNLLLRGLDIRPYPQ